MTDIARLRERIQHREARAQVRAEARAHRRARRARQRIDRLRQQALLAGTAARTRYEALQTGEARALRLARTRTAALAALLPVLLAFGAWSAAGVQAGMVTLLGLQPGSVAAAAAWLVEPALIGVVATVILVRARLRSVGGDLDVRATRVEWAALSLSILLNAVGHWPDDVDATAFAALVGHALGPVGAAGTAYLISVIQDGISSADPWHLGDGSPAPSLAGAEAVAAEPEQSTGVGDRSQFTWPVEPPRGVSLLPIVATPEPANLTGEAPANLTGEAPMNLTGEAPANLTGEAPMNLTGEAPMNLTGEAPANLTGEAPANLTGEAPMNLTGATSEPRESKAKQRKRRPRRAHRSASPVRRKTVEERAYELDSLIRSGELTETSSVNRVRTALRCSPENAKRAIEWRRAHLVGEPAERLTGELVDAAFDPHELAVEPALTAAR